MAFPFHGREHSPAAEKAFPQIGALMRKMYQGFRASGLQGCKRIQAQAKAQTCTTAPPSAVRAT